MENGYKIRVVLFIASLAAISIYFTARHRRQRKHKSPLSLCYLHNEPKPQSAFKRVLADNSYTQFKHLKLNDSSDENASNVHPYEAEITELLKIPPEINLNAEIVDVKMNDTYIWVQTEMQLKELVNVLSRERFLAVDTEQHSLRSFLGFTALVQISTQQEDYLIDTIALHDVMSILRPVFANPSICKVFHGADNDVVWLQRDFHIYIVNLFDTSKACEVLSKPQKSLAYLLETYCGVTTNKLLQREDWRQRPLSLEMIHYARTDARYLLYIANCLINELKQQDNVCSDDKLRFVNEASRRSNMICLQLFTKEVEGSPGESAALSLFSHRMTVSGQDSTSVPDETQFQNIVRQLCAWRDLMARVHDESLKYVLSDQAIVALANQGRASHSEIYNAIAQADINVEMSPNSFIPSPSSVVCSHLNDIYCLLMGELGKVGDIYSVILQKCLGPNGICPLSIFNYALLVSSSPKPALAYKHRTLKNSKQFSRKASRDLFVQKFSCKSPVYHNCRIYANDGRLLCYCDRRKLEWYLSRDLAKLVDEDPPAIMLLFEPKGRPEDEDNDFYIQIAHAAAEKYKRKIAAEFGIPLYVCRVVDPGQLSMEKFEECGVSPLQLRTAAMALLRHGPRMPPNRRQELIEIVKRYYGGREMSEGDLERALLVGMTPHERRKFEKKRGFSFKHSTGNIDAKTEKENQGDCTPGMGNMNESNDNTLDDSYATEVTSNEDGEFSMLKDYVGNPSLLSNQAVDEVVPASYENTSLVKTRVSNERSPSAVNADDSSQSRRQPNGIGDLSCPHADEEITRGKHNSKLSLLGHGPHGKQVVEHILKEEGEDGIRHFCQRWRTVFVGAVNPRFLPAGWDVKHRL
ncbi:hypothetical protein L6164_018823 [Bauhinia variegata]|uniref:Uncharacterized protein n=1 Tax=Bauhinia variegata TaxID=167791 RepID=A0ACB9NCD6_BAUVA|nr:hypothetical protein L6164_018823 [Bauhinia variegata]